MKTKELKEKLKDDFEKILESETKLEVLNTTFSKIITEIETTSESENQKLKEAESNQASGTKKTEVKSWEDFKKKMKVKYGF